MARIKPRKFTMLPDTDPRMVEARNAGILRANEVYLHNGWRKAPAQCPICENLLTTCNNNHHETMSILTAWTDAYMIQCNHLADQIIDRLNQTAA